MPASMSVEAPRDRPRPIAELSSPTGGVSAAVAERIAPPSARRHHRALPVHQPASPAARVAHTGENLGGHRRPGRRLRVAGVGTGGTISGVAKGPRRRTQTYASLPFSRRVSPADRCPAPTAFRASCQLRAKTFDADIIDEVISVETPRRSKFARNRACAERVCS